MIAALSSSLKPYPDLCHTQIHIFLCRNPVWRMLPLPLQRLENRGHSSGNVMDPTESINWDRTPPKIPILGSNEINSSPYTEASEDASTYERYLDSRSPTLNRKFDLLTRLGHWLISSFRLRSSPFSDDKLMEMILKDYPRRTDILIDVMDFSPTRSERSQQKLQDVSACKLILSQCVACTD